MTIAAQIYTIALTANGANQLLAGGAFFKILSASGSVAVRGAFGTLSPIGAGMGMKESPFDRLEFTDLSGAPNSLTILVASREFIDSSVGNVGISSNRVPQSGVYTSAQATVTNVSGNLKAANSSRQYLLIQNNDLAGYLYVNLAGAVATAANGIKIAPGGSYEANGCVPTGAITAIGDIASNANVVVVEG